MISIRSVTGEIQIAKKIVIWIIPIVFLYSIILRFSLTFTSNEVLQNINEEASEGTASNKVFWIILFSLAIFSWSKVQIINKNKFGLNYHLYLLILYVAYSIISAIWSDVPLISLRRSIQQFIIVFCMMTPFLLGTDKKEILDKVSWVFVFFVMINIVMIPIFGIPDFGYRGICPQKNILGQVSCLAFFFSFFQILKCKGYKKIIFFIIAILSIILIVISKSKTSFGLSIPVLILAYLTMQFMSIKDSLVKIMIGTFFISFILIFTSVVLINQLSIYDFSQYVFNNSTFTGRDFIWDFASNNIYNAPYFGHGYGSFWGVKTIGVNFIRAILQAHNGYLDIVLDLGFIGLAVVILLIIGLFKSTIRFFRHDFIFGILLLSCLYFVIINNMMESSLFRGFTPLWIVFLFCAGLTLNRKP